MDYHQNPKVNDNGDGTWTVTDGLYGQTWTILRLGYHPTTGHPHYTASLEGDTRVGFSGSFDEVCFNILGHFE